MQSFAGLPQNKEIALSLADGRLTSLQELKNPSAYSRVSNTVTAGMPLGLYLYPSGYGAPMSGHMKSAWLRPHVVWQKKLRKFSQQLGHLDNSCCGNGNNDSRVTS